MIPKRYTGKTLEGRKVRIDREMRNGAGAGITPGIVATIVRVVRGRGLVIKTDTCPHCGMYAYITGVPREYLTLIEQGERWKD